jgi:hypothetical protein
MTTLPQHNLVQHGHDDILCSVADAAFLQNSFIATRDYLSIKIWDTRNANEPVNCLPVHECLAAHIDELYDSDAVFDRFGLAIDQHTGTIVSGMYDGQVVIWQPDSAQPPLYIRGHFDDSSIGTAGPLSWSEDPAYYANRVTNVGDLRRRRHGRFLIARQVIRLRPGPRRPILTRVLTAPLVRSSIMLPLVTRRS